VSSAVESVALRRLTVQGRVTQAHVLRSEWTKLVSLRSTRWSLLVATVLAIALSALFAAVTSSHWGGMSAHDRADRHPLDIALAGVNLSQLAIGVLGVLVITGEYSTGMIRASMTAVPKRLAVGSIVRNTAGGIVVFVAIFFVIPPLLDILPTSWNNAVSPYLPDAAGRSIFSLTHGAHSLAPGPGLALFVGYCALAVAIAAVLLVRRDV